MEEFYAFLWKLLEGVLIAVLPVLATTLTVWLVQKIREIGKDMSAEVVYSIEAAARIAVDAAEQAGLAGLIENKKEYALGFAQEYLDRRGVKVNLSLLDGLIEAAVMEAFPHKTDPHEMTDR